MSASAGGYGGTSSNPHFVGSSARSVRRRLKSLSLFTGCGGLDIGLEQAGFRVQLCVEIDEACRRTLQANRPQWPLSRHGDIFSTSPMELRLEAGLRRKELDLLAGGPPCQPFSKAAFWHAGDAPRLDDPRSKTIQAFFAVVAETLPRAVLLENVAGFAYADKDEAWRLCCDHFRQINRRNGTAYAPQLIRLNAADYGVPQQRHRIFVIASRNGRNLLAPAITHAQMDHDAKKGPKQYLTAWDAIGTVPNDDLDDDLSLRGKWARLVPSIPEGLNYLYHSPGGGGEPLFGKRTRYWSFLLKLSKAAPAWTIVASPGPGTGPFHWDNRQLSRRELSRLQTLPDSFRVVGDYSTARRQIGNAVPPLLGELLGLEIRRQLLDQRVRRKLRLALQKNAVVPPPEIVAEVPEEYHSYRAAHVAHPGPGLGPGALKRPIVQLRLDMTESERSAL